MRQTPERSLGWSSAARLGRTFRVSRIRGTDMPGISISVVFIAMVAAELTGAPAWLLWAGGAPRAFRPANLVGAVNRTYVTGEIQADRQSRDGLPLPE
jgi:hypothetical protein